MAEIATTPTALAPARRRGLSNSQPGSASTTPTALKRSDLEGTTPTALKRIGSIDDSLSNSLLRASKRAAVDFSAPTASTMARKTAIRSSVVVPDEKENQNPQQLSSRRTTVLRKGKADAVAPAPEAPISRMRRPTRVEGLIKSKDESATNVSISAGADGKETTEEESSLHEQLRGTLSVDVEELLAWQSKLGKYEATKKAEEQKVVITKLKKGVQELLAKREELIDRILSLTGELSFKDTAHVEELGTFKEQAQGLQQSIEDYQNECKSLSSACEQLRIQLEHSQTAKSAAESSLATTTSQLKEKITEVSLLEGKLQASLAKLGACEQDLAAAKAQAAQAETNHLSALRDIELRMHSKETDIVEEKKRAEELQKDHNSALTRIAVIEEQCNNARAEVERLRLEKDEIKESMAVLTSERDSANVRLSEMQLRLDAKEASMNDTIKTLMAGQQMHAERVQELCSERESLNAELTRARAEANEIREEMLKLTAENNDRGVELRLVCTELTQTKTCLDGLHSELNSTRQRLMDMTQAKAEVSEKFAMLEAEYNIFKIQAKLPNLDQIERLCALEADKIGMNSKMSAAELEREETRREAERLRKEVAELQAKLHSGEVARRKLHNELQEIKGNIRVFARVRPGSDAEGNCPLTLCDESGTVVPATPELQQFKFDRVFGQRTSQEEVFAEVSNFVQSALDGYNVVLFAYGQTGAGKTHTMIGGKDPEFRGVIPRSIEQILRTVNAQSQNGWTYELEASFLEIYNETIRDLLVEPSPAGSKSGAAASAAGDDDKLAIRHGDYGTMQVTNLTSRVVKNSEDVAALMHTADRNRSYARTEMNEHSSRSHSVFQLRIKATLNRQLGGGRKQVQELRGQLNLVDLAGSERLQKSQATGDRLKETQSINKSLSALCDVFTALSNKQSHVPYRNSKLTFLLQPCLSGDGKALVIVNLSPAETSLSESLCTLRFASMVSSCELGKAKRHVQSSSSQSNNNSNGDNEDGTSTPAPSATPSAAGGAAVARSATGLTNTGVKRPLTAPTLASANKDDKKFRR